MLRSTALAVVLVLASSVPIASALEPPPLCCVCTATGGEMAQSSGANPINGTSVPALFCASVAQGNTTALADRCHELTGGSLLCLESIVNSSSPSCRVQLADSLGVLCPTSAAPAASGASILSLAVVLASLGALLQRRKRQRGTIE